jgi:hypothetical protein
MMKMIDLLIQSRFSYTPTDDEWCEFWYLLKGDERLLEDNFVNDIFLVWRNGHTPTPRQKYFLFKRVFPKARLGPPPKRRSSALKDFLDE